MVMKSDTGSLFVYTYIYPRLRHIKDEVHFDAAPCLETTAAIKLLSVDQFCFFCLVKDDKQQKY